MTRTQPGDRGLGRRRGRHQVGHRRPDHDRAGPNRGEQRARRAQRVGRAAEHGHQPVALHGDQHVEAGVPGRPPDAVHHGFGRVVRRRADHDGHRRRRPPAERGRARPQRLVGFAAHQRVDDHRLEAGVPGAAGFGRLGVDLGGREGDLAGVDQHRFPQVGRLVGRGDALGRGFDDADRDAHHLDGLLQAHGSGQFARSGAEHLAGDFARRGRRA